MDEKNVLVVYYSRTGTTRKVAAAIAEKLQCNLEEVVDTKGRSGVLGYLVSVKDAMCKKRADIEPVKNDPAGYDLVVIGTPVWAFSMSCPIRAYLAQQKERLPDVAFFLTTGSTAIERTFRHMGELSGKAPKATLGLKMKKVLKGDYEEQVEGFVEELNR